MLDRKISRHVRASDAIEKANGQHKRRIHPRQMFLSKFILKTACPATLSHALGRNSNFLQGRFKMREGDECFAKLERPTASRPHLKVLSIKNLNQWKRNAAKNKFIN